MYDHAATWLLPMPVNAVVFAKGLENNPRLFARERVLNLLRQKSL
jgi:hypothetical protein